MTKSYHFFIFLLDNYLLSTSQLAYNMNDSTSYLFVKPNIAKAKRSWKN